MQLDTVYASPGFLLLAQADDGARLGCVGLRSLAGDEAADDGSRVGEVRRLFVRPEGRGMGLGRDLARTLQDHASSGGLDRLVLNTLPEMREAIGLYESMGFTPCEPYVDEPLEGVLYFSLDLDMNAEA